jgi:hypothetical protein
MTNDKTVFSVNLWGSHPDANNDDCWIGDEFATIEAARAAYDNFRAHFETPNFSIADCAYVELARGDRCGGTLTVETIAVKRNPNFVPLATSDDDWRREMAMEAGMAFGVQGYNDMMGY